MGASSPLARTAFVGGALALAAGAYAVGHRAGEARDAPPSVAPVSGLDVSDHVGVIPDGGSFYYARTSNDPLPPTRIKGALYTDRADECTNGCPIGMKMMEGPEAFTQGATAVNSVAPHLDALATAAEATYPEFAATLRAVRRGHAAWAAATAPRARRVFSLGMPRPDYGDGAAMIVFAIYDHCDPVFDFNRVEDCPSGGAHTLVARIEKRVGPRRTVVTGMVEVEERPTSGESGEEVVAGTAAIPVMTVVAPIYMHFGSGRRGRVHGLYLDAEGHVFAFGADRAPRPLPPDEDLAKALVLVLKRA